MSANGKHLGCAGLALHQSTHGNRGLEPEWYRWRIGRVLLKENRALFARFAAPAGVPDSTVVALRGIESNYGTRLGDFEVMPVAVLDRADMAPADLDLASLDILLQRVRRHPRDRALRLAAARDVAVLADQAARGGDKLLQEAGSIARMLQRALDRSNKAAVADEADLAAVNAWIDTLHGQLLRAITR